MLKTLGITAALGALLMFAMPSSASAQRRWGFRGPRAVVVAPGWGWGPGWYGYYGPYWGPYGYGYAVPNTGEVKIVTHLKEAPVYVDGGFAGTAGKLKHFDLSPGNHSIEVRDPAGKTLFQQQIQVIRGKTAEIHVD